MSRFEDRVRAGLDGAAAGFAPSPGLRADVDRRVRRHRRARVAWGVASAVGALVLVAGLGVLLATDDQGNQAEGYAGTSLPVETVVVDDPVECPFVGGYSRPDAELTARYVGLPESEAVARANSAEVPIRVVCRDGVHADLPTQLRNGRLNLEVDAGVVVAIEVEDVPYSTPAEPRTSSTQQ